MKHFNSTRMLVYQKVSFSLTHQA